MAQPLFDIRGGVEGEKPKLSFKERMRALRYLPELFRAVWAVSHLMTSCSVILRVIRAFVPVASLYVGKLILDEILNMSRSGGGMGKLWEYLAIELGLVLLSDLLARGMSLTDSLLGDKFANVSSVKIMRHAATLDMEYFEDGAFYDKLERARQQTMGRMALVSQVFSQAQEVLSMAFFAVGLVAFNPWLIVLIVMSLVPAFIGESYFNAKNYSLLFGWTPERRLLDYLRYTGASNETAKEIKVFGLSQFVADQYEMLATKFYAANRNLAFRRAGWGTVMSAIGSFGYYAAYIVIVTQAVSGEISIGSVTFLAGSFGSLQNYLRSILARFSSIAENSLYLRDYFDFLAIRPRIVSPEKPIPVPHPIKQGFVFENVGFRYGKSERWAVRNLSFTLKAGEKLALVGENGSGKTTIVKLLARLYDPTEGRILLDGRDLKEYDIADLRDQIGVIFQDYARYQMTAAGNIGVGRVDMLNDDERIATAAAQSLADSVVDKLPGKYGTMLGRRFSGGAELSGGEWQKVALARAYMRDAQVLILDEPTSALDARAEYEVFQRIAALMTGKTVVMISHRFSTVRMADRILVLNNGQPEELGSHEELIANGARYAELFRLQAQGYR